MPSACTRVLITVKWNSGCSVGEPMETIRGVEVGGKTFLSFYYIHTFSDQWKKAELSRLENVTTIYLHARTHARTHTHMHTRNHQTRIYKQKAKGTEKQTYPEYVFPLDRLT